MKGIFQPLIQERILNFKILGTSGDQENAERLDSAISTSDAFMLLYSIKSKSSWKELISFRNKIFERTKTLNNGNGVPLIIVGTKTVCLLFYLL